MVIINSWKVIGTVLNNVDKKLRTLNWYLTVILILFNWNRCNPYPSLNNPYWSKNKTVTWKTKRKKKPKSSWDFQREDLGGQTKICLEEWGWKEVEAAPCFLASLLFIRSGCPEKLLCASLGAVKAFCHSSSCFYALQFQFVLCSDCL